MHLRRSRDVAFVLERKFPLRALPANPGQARAVGLELRLRLRKMTGVDVRGQEKGRRFEVVDPTVRSPGGLLEQVPGRGQWQSSAIGVIRATAAECPHGPQP